jgi:hypothetical protein
MSRVIKIHVGEGLYKLIDEELERTFYISLIEVVLKCKFINTKIPNIVSTSTTIERDNKSITYTRKQFDKIISLMQQGALFRDLAIKMIDEKLKEASRV